jgi:DNA primase
MNLVEVLASSNDYYTDPDDDYENEYFDNGNALLDRQQFVQRQKLISRDGRQQRQPQQQIRTENDDDDDDDDVDELIESIVALGEVINDDGVSTDNSQPQMFKSQKIYQSNNNYNNIHNGKGDESLTNNGLLNPQLSQSSSSTPLSQAQQQQQQQQRITTEQINYIKSFISLVDVIESYNLPQFTRTSSSTTAKACCPFHNDNNPSLYIDDNCQLYKCFACGAGGDVFNFMQI